jgi:hypothetical protein
MGIGLCVAAAEMLCIEMAGTNPAMSKHPVRTAGGRAQAASFTSLGFQFQGRSCSRFWML